MRGRARAGPRAARAGVGGPRGEPAPYGFDPGEIFAAEPGDPAFALMRLDARRIELAGAPGEDGPPQPAVWRAGNGSRRPAGAA